MFFALSKNLWRKQLTHSEQLKLHCGTTDFCCRINESQATTQIPMMIAGNFCDESDTHLK
jgi:hypothetical protein